jgi:phosphoribosylanthranilate isomerase
MVKVKICGITNVKDALAAVNAGCDAVGFVFYKKSPRYVTPEKVKEIVKQLPKQVIKVGVFVNAKEKEILRIAKLCKLDILQFHGNESPEFCRKFKGHKIVQAFRIKDKIDLKQVLRYKVFAYLFDTFVKSEIGGTGKKFEWKLLIAMNNIKQPIFLSGGLTAENVKKAIDAVGPHWVDVSSSVEIRPGKKDHIKIKKFIKAVKK